jgi:hypothetical protein
VPIHDYSHALASPSSSHPYPTRPILPYPPRAKATGLSFILAQSLLLYPIHTIQPGGSILPHITHSQSILSRPAVPKIPTSRSTPTPTILHFITQTQPHTSLSPDHCLDIFNASLLLTRKDSFPRTLQPKMTSSGAVLPIILNNHHNHHDHHDGSHQDHRQYSFLEPRSLQSQDQSSPYESSASIR